MENKASSYLQTKESNIKMYCHFKKIWVIKNITQIFKKMTIQCKQKLVGLMAVSTQFWLYCTL